MSTDSPLPGIPHGNGRRIQATLSTEDARAVGDFRDAGYYPNDSAAVVALIRAGLAAFAAGAATQSTPKTGANDAE